MSLCVCESACVCIYYRQILFFHVLVNFEMLGYLDFHKVFFQSIGEKSTSIFLVKSPLFIKRFIQYRLCLSSVTVITGK